MLDNQSFVCVMLARGGSKGLANKNLKLLHGKPLIYYTIKAIQDAGFFDRIILSTDSIEIADVARQYGVDVPFMRPSVLAEDLSNAADAVVHALKWLEENDRKYDNVQYIFPTAPLRTGKDICAGAEMLIAKRADMIISVCETEHSKFWSNTLPEDLSLKRFIEPEYRSRNRQELPTTYRLNGSIFVGKWDIFRHKHDWFECDTYAYIMSKERSVDIDSLIDFQHAELLLTQQKKEEGFILSYVVDRNASIKDGFKLEGINRIKCVVVVDENQAVCGIVTDGDFRRAILNGASLLDPINIIMNEEFMFVQKNYDVLEVKEIFMRSNIWQVLVIDDGRLIDVITRDSFTEDDLCEKQGLVDVPVVIMAGGKGTRLDPFTKVLPKPLIPVDDIPIIELIMNRFAEYGSRTFYISINHKARMIKAFFEEAKSPHNISFIVEEEFLGTAGSLKYLENRFAEPFFVSNCDIVAEIDYMQIYEFHIRKDYDITIVGSMEEHIVPYGICRLNSDGDLSSIDEKPKYDFLVNVGIYVISPRVLSLIKTEEKIDMTELIERAKNSGMKQGVYPIATGEWMDVGQMNEYQKVLHKIEKLD